jgi:hypothetical protein
MPTFRIVAQYQRKMDNELLGQVRNLFERYQVKRAHRCKPDGTGNIYEIVVTGHGRALHITDELTKLGMEAEFTQEPS